MFSLPILRVALREMTTRERCPRVTEPDLVMDDPEKVSAYVRAGREDGVMAPVYLYHCAQICEVIRPGDTVIDLACGPATQLGLVARLNPDVKFIGIDLSEPMLERARSYIQELGLKNVELRLGNITTLASIEDKSIDAVMSTMALHHLPDLACLKSTFSEIGRVLKENGGVYLADFGHLRSEKSIDYFAHQYADRQPELFTLDYLYSLRAAFSIDDFRKALQALSGRATLYSTFGFPFMVVVKSPVRRRDDPALRKALQEIRRDLPGYHETDIKDLKTLMQRGGLRSLLLD